MTVIGVQDKEGTYEGIAYHNYLIHCVKDDGDALGQVTEVVKVKVSKCKEIFGKSMSLDDMDDLIGKDIRCYYDKYGSVNEIRIL